MSLVQVNGFFVYSIFLCTMVWKCPICVIFIAVTLRILMRHIFSEHSYKPDFRVECSVSGCKQVYRKYNSYYRHTMKYHLDMLDTQAEFVVNNTPVQETNDAQTARVHNNVSVHETNDLEMVRLFSCFFFFKFVNITCTVGQ